MFVERVGMTVGSHAFVRFEAFNGLVYLLVSDIFEGGAGRWVEVVWVDVVILWGGEEKESYSALALSLFSFASICVSSVHLTLRVGMQVLALSPGGAKVPHGYTTGQKLRHHTHNRGYHTRHGYGYIPNHKCHGIR